MTVRRAYIPLEPTASASLALQLWVSLDPDDATTTEDSYPPGALFLIENYQWDDEWNPRVFSAYSSLLLLAKSLGDAPEVQRLASTLAAEFRSEANARVLFAQDPIGSLSALGAQFGAERRVKAIYRIRACCVDDIRRTTTAIGYPVVIQGA